MERLGQPSLLRFIRRGLDEAVHPGADEKDS